MCGRLVSFIGLIFFLGMAWALSTDKRRVPWRVVVWGLLLQFLVALLILRTEFGRRVFDLAGVAVQKLVGFANEGCRFVFGPLADGSALVKSFGPEHGYIVAIVITGTIILVSTISSVLYHWGILQRMVQFVATIMRYCMKTSGSETLAAAANIFMGQTEAPLLVRPYIGRMTQSELMCLMTGGMATIAGGVGAVYAELGRQAGYPDMAGHLLTASVMSAPATLLVAKLMMPEKEQPETAKCVPRLVERTTSNTIDAMCKGAADGMKLSINVVAMLIAFVAVVALLNFVFQKVQVWLGCASPITLQTVVGWLNMPFAWLMGVPAKDCLVVGQALGERIVLNEFIGYLTLTSNAASLTDRGFVLGTYALCGFANFGSVAIQVGGIGALVPERRADLAKLGLRAMVAGTLACYITACIVGILT